MSVQALTEWIFPRMVELRRTFHRYPELAFEEEQTALVIMKLNKIRTTSLFINPSLAEPCRDITIKIVQELAHGGVFPVLVDWVIGLTPGIHFEIDFFVIHSLVIIHFGA